MMIIGVPDEQLARTHWRHGGGRGALGYRHIPSGISVYRECPAGVPVQAIDAELLIELQEALRSRGNIPAATEANPGVHLNGSGDTKLDCREGNVDS
jgi:hypothetical protein